ncbi:MAG: phosphoadenosine phosphosulfate reductase family protein [Bacteroidales bacterium]|jgi:3'-phosphoadenosine 5'-phosphosulfate sulfotransferase (PAPS reductase)/FAD synthetase|nr:phosphoadenosine phosphosulfate reductase family protein [Bacteroidales bacterium]
MTYEDLKQRQSWTLEQKIDHAVTVVSSFMEKVQGKVFVSYSGGKDSLCTLDIIRRFIDRDIPAVFCNTGNEYPEVVKFVRQTENVTIIRPELNIRQIVEKYGFPLISKEQSQYIRQAKHTHSEKLSNSAIHCASLASLLRPGICFMCNGLTNFKSKPSSHSMSYIGIQ